MNEKEHSTFMLGDKSFDFIKKSVQIGLPAVSSLYFGLASIWNLPEPEKVVGTLAVFTTFLGIVLGISTAQYNASDKAYGGQINVTPKLDGPTMFDLVVKGDPMSIVDKKSVTFKINTDTTLVESTVLAESDSKKKS